MNKGWKAVALTIASLAFLASCAPTQTITSPPLATSEGRIANGFQFTVTVSNVHPRMGESITISAELLNLFNTTFPSDRMYSDFILQISDDQGNIVWKEINNRILRTTTPAPPVTTGFSWKFARTWTAGGRYTAPATGTYTPVLRLAAGTYTLNASITLFGLAVTPIQIAVSD